MLKLYPVKQKFCLLSFSLLLVITAQSQISTFAGRHYYLGDNGPAVSAGLFNPYATARDSSGNLYIATTKDNIVRKVDAATQVITTIAGTGVSGFSGDGGPATAAQLNFQSNGLPGIAVDKNGNVYISDYFNNRIRKIDAATKIISTIAGTGIAGYSGDGGLATSAKINGPAGIVADASGNIFFADNNNNVIRRIDAVTKIITAYAGNINNGGYSGDGGPATSAGLSYPECITLDAAGNLFISDEYNNAIRRVDAGTSIITTVAGNGSHGFAGDGGLATSATLGYTMGIAVDAAGNLYIADQTNNRIRKVTASTKKISTIAGTGTAGYSGDGGLATSAQVKKPTYLQVDVAGNVFVDDLGNGRIRKISASNSYINTVAGDGSDGFTGAPDALQAQLLPQAITIDASGNLFIADGYYYDVRAINVANSSYAYAGAPNPDYKYASKGYAGNGSYASAALYNAPFGVAVDASNNLYIADVFNNVIRKVAYSSKFVTTVAGNNSAGYSGDNVAATSTKLNNPYGVAVDKNGNLYIADALNNRIRKVASATQVIITIAGTGAAGSSGDGSAATAALLNNPTGVAVDTAGDVFILDRSNKKIRMIAASTQKISTVLNNGHVLSGVATDVTGNVFVSDSTAGTIIRLTAKTYTDSVVAGTGTPGYADNASAATSGKLNYPGGLVVSSSGYIYVADINNNVIRKLLPAVATSAAIKNNIVSTTDATSTCSGDSIKITTLSGNLPTGGAGSYIYKWLKSVDGATWSTFSGNTSQNCAINAYVKKTIYYRRVVTSGTYFDSSNIISFSFFARPVPVITNSGALSFCKGGKDTLSTSAAFTSYLWSTGASSRQLIDSVSGTFKVTVTDSHGCTGTSAAVKIVVYSPAKVTITSNPSTTTNLCAGSLVSLASSSAAKYKWSTGATTQSINVSTAGSYTVTITDANSCTNISAAKVVSYKTCGPPSSIKAVNITGTTTTLTWRKVVCAVKYKLQYAVFGTNNWTVITTSTADTSYSLTGLTKSTKYQWHVSTVCAVSPSVISDTSKVGTFTTTSSATLQADGVPATSADASVAGKEGFSAIVFPNPATGPSMLTINAPGKTAITITDMSGRTIWQAAATGSRQVALPSEKFAAGMYFITVRDEKNQKVLKFIKQ